MAEVKQIPVQILGKEYLVACGPDEVDALLASARTVDIRMREIRDTRKVVGTERIAVMAALNLAHELLKSGEGVENGEVTARLRTIQGKIEALLAADDRRQKFE